MDYNFTTNDLLVIVLALVFVVYIIAQTIIRWKETGSITESFKYAFDALGNAPIVKRGAEVVINRLDDKGRKAVYNVLNAADPFTDFVPGDWDQDTIDWVRGLLDKAPGLSTPPSLPVATGGNVSYVGELERLKNVALTPSPSPSGRGEQVQQPLHVAVNENPQMVVDMHGLGNWHDEAKRVKETPTGYSLAWQTYKSDDTFAPPPEVHGMANGLQIELAHRRGRLIFNQNVHDVLRAGQRYLLKVKVKCDLKLKADAKIDGAIAIKGQLCNGDVILKNLPAWSPDNVFDLREAFEALWVIGTGVGYQKLNYQVLVEVGNVDTVPFDDDSRITIEAIELMPVDVSYGGTQVVTF